MGMPVRLSGVVFLLALPAACSTVPVNAPVGSRVVLPQTQPAATASPATAGQKPGYYSVRRGDTLYSIAWQNGLNFRQLADMNAIHSPYTIYVGQSLRLAPAASVPPSPRPVATARTEPVPTASPVPLPAPGPVMATSPATTVQTTAAQLTPVPEPVAEPEPALPAVVSRWVWPAKGPLLRGYAPETNGKKGIDIGGSAGQPIMAAADGKVVYSGSGLVGYGRLIIIKHNDNLLSAYGHNSELLVAEGDYVKAGQVIAKMGSSGTSSTRLYFEIRQDGKPVNPLRFLPRS
jgi:lipoprotein NlpD